MPARSPADRRPAAAREALQLAPLRLAPPAGAGGSAGAGAPARPGGTRGRKRGAASEAGAGRGRAGPGAGHRSAGTSLRAAGCHRRLNIDPLTAVEICPTHVGVSDRSGVAAEVSPPLSPTLSRCLVERSCNAGGRDDPTGGLGRHQELALQRRRVQLWTEGAGHRGDHSAWEALNGAVQSLDHDRELWRTRGLRTQALLSGSLATRKQRVLVSLVEAVPRN